MQFYKFFCNLIKIRSVDAIKKISFKMFYSSHSPNRGVKLLSWVPLPLYNHLKFQTACQRQTSETW